VRDSQRLDDNDIVASVGSKGDRAGHYCHNVPTTP
jgi:hypothetical protein